MQHSTYRGISITDYRPSYMACPVMVHFPQPLGSLGSVTLEAAHQRIDKFLAHMEEHGPARLGNYRVVAVDFTPGRSHSASAGRRAAERARGQKRKGGRFQ